MVLPLVIRRADHSEDAMVIGLDQSSSRFEQEEPGPCPISYRLGIA